MKEKEPNKPEDKRNEGGRSGKGTEARYAKNEDSGGGKEGR